MGCLREISSVLHLTKVPVACGVYITHFHHNRSEVDGKCDSGQHMEMRSKFGEQWGGDVMGRRSDLSDMVCLWCDVNCDCTKSNMGLELIYHFSHFCFSCTILKKSVRVT
jgi:hypothetical protein